MKTVYPNLHAMRTIRMQHIWVSDRSSLCGRIISAPTLTLYFYKNSTLKIFLLFLRADDIRPYRIVQTVAMLRSGMDSF